MNKHDGYNGVFLADNSEFSGHLSIAGADSLVTLVGKNFWPSLDTEYEEIHGYLVNGSKVSLLSCSSYGKTQYRFDENTQYESKFFPNYVVVGETFVRSDEPVIRAIRYHFENVIDLLSGHNTFRSFMAEPDDVRVLLETQHRRSEQIAKEHGWPKPSFEPEIGKHPRLMYFSGVWEFMGFDVNTGRIALTNRTSHKMGNAAGIGVDNQVSINIEFHRPMIISEAIREMYTLHGLFELSLGYRQRYKWIELELTHREKIGEHERYQTAELYWSMCNKRVEVQSRASGQDALLAPDRRPEEFAKVAAGWMDSASNMGDPRERFATAFFGNYGINRIVGAANMFDLLPESHAPKKKNIDAQMQAAVEKCREIFTSMPDTSARQSVLSVLGRVGTASLRDKVLHRAEKVTKIAGEQFSELHLPCKQAVLCRNHYVHGSPAPFEYRDNFTEFAFIVDTLEFVFAASDLIDLGWDLKAWMRGGPMTSHAFGAYVLDYSSNLHRLKALVER